MSHQEDSETCQVDSNATQKRSHPQLEDFRRWAFWGKLLEMGQLWGDEGPFNISSKHV